MPRREQRPQTAGHQALIKPLPLWPAVPGGYTLDDFTVDEPVGAVTCRAGVTRPINKSGTWSSGRPAAAARCGLGARPPQRARPCGCTSTTRRYVAHADRTLRGSKPPVAPADGRAIDRVADPRQPQAPIPRRGQQRRVAAPPDRGAQPAPAPRPRPHPTNRGSGRWRELNAGIETG
jgi:hypothetical protein